MIKGILSIVGVVITLTIFAGCAATSSREQITENSVMQKRESDLKVHGEVGVMVGGSG